MIKRKEGFTLIELLVVISIIGVLSSVVLSSLRSARDKAMAVKFVADFNSIAKGWALWQADTGSNFFNEISYYNNGVSNAGLAPCFNATAASDEPRISDTDLYSNRTGLAGWNGPYLPLNSFGNEFNYDDDSNVNTPMCVACGVGVHVEWCAGNGGNYLRVAPLIDKIIDNGDGNLAGKFVWFGDASRGFFRFNIAKSSSE